MTAEELRALRRKWVAGAFPTTGETQARAALVIDGLIEECFAVRERLRIVQAQRDDQNEYMRRLERERDKARAALETINRIQEMILEKE